MSHAAEEHADLARLRERITAAQERGYTEGDVNHEVQPVIGMMRMTADRARQHGGTAVQVDLRALDSWIEHLERACSAEIAWLHPPERKGNS